MNTSRHRLALPAGHRLHWYTLESVIGQGGFGITYLARDTNLEQPVAIKEFLPAELASRDSDSQVHPLTDGHTDTFSWGLSRFVTEAQTLARFRHPNIVRVVSVFEANNTAYMVMEYERGESLEDAFRLGRIRDEAAMRALLAPLLDGLEHVHAAGFIHRDIKPDNIYLRADGTPVLLDFGSARQALGVAARTLTALVSPGYAPFEQYDNSRDAEARQGPWTDVYALGATVYRGITGSGPPDAMARVNAAMAGGDVYRPLAGRTGVGFGPVFLAAVDRALGLRPEDRPASIEAWRCCLDGRPEPIVETATPTTRAEDVLDQDAPTEIAATGSRHAATPAAAAPTRSRPAGAAVALLLVVMAGAAGWWMRGGEPSKAGASSPTPRASPEAPAVESAPVGAGAGAAEAPANPPSAALPAAAATTQPTGEAKTGAADTSTTRQARTPSAPTATASSPALPVGDATIAVAPALQQHASAPTAPAANPAPAEASVVEAAAPMTPAPQSQPSSLDQTTAEPASASESRTTVTVAANTPAPAQEAAPSTATPPAPATRAASSEAKAVDTAGPEPGAAQATPTLPSIAILPVYPESLTWDSGGAAPDDVVDALRAAVAARKDIELRSDQAWGTTDDAVPGARALWGDHDPDEPPDEATVFRIGERLGVDLVVLWSLDPLDTTADWPVYIDVYVTASQRRYRLEGGAVGAARTLNRLLDRALGL